MVGVFGRGAALIQPQKSINIIGDKKIVIFFNNFNNYVQ